MVAYDAFSRQRVAVPAAERTARPARKAEKPTESAGRDLLQSLAILLLLTAVVAARLWFALPAGAAIG